MGAYVVVLRTRDRCYSIIYGLAFWPVRLPPCPPPSSRAKHLAERTFIARKALGFAFAQRDVLFLNYLSVATSGLYPSLYA